MLNNSISIIGAGEWGSALASQFAKNDDIKKITLYSRNSNVVNEINNLRIFPKFPSISASEKIHATNSLNEAIESSELIFIAVSSQSQRDVLSKINVKGRKFICCSKGIEIKTKKFMYELYEEFMNLEQIFTISGPNFAVEIINDMPAISIISGNDDHEAKRISNLISSDSLKFYHSTDQIAVQIGGALKNVFAIAAGILKSQNLGENILACFIASSLEEMNMLLEAKAGKESSIITLLGASGAGDLVLTAMNPHKSRNSRLGLMIGEGKKINEIIAGGTFEGYHSVKIIRDITDQLKINLPICNSIFSILYENGNVDNIINALLKR